MQNSNNSKKKRSWFKLDKDGIGISKNALENPKGLKKFFRVFGTNFGKLVSVNIFMILGNFPIFCAIAAASGYTQVERMIPTSDLFQNILGWFSTPNAISPADMSVFAVEGMQYQTLTPTTTTYVLYGISLLFLFTFGLVNAGTAYIIRNMVSGEPVFVWTDFWYAVKRNYKQAIGYGIIDTIVCFFLVYNIYSMFSTLSGAFLTSFMFWGNVLLLLLYFCMRFYIYLQLVTFDLKLIKIIKNSLIFTLVGVKRNLAALLGIFLILLLEAICIFGLGGVLVPIAVAMPLAILFSFCAFIKLYAAYDKIKQYMIDPYYKEHPKEKPEAEDFETVMTDDVTEKERLNEIKRKNNISLDT